MSQQSIHSNSPASRFRFRLIAREEPANRLVTLAIQSLRYCYPHAGIVLVDANDQPQFQDLNVKGDFSLVHLPPHEDEIATVAGRGSRRHLYWWRHSPRLLRALPTSDQFDVHVDADLIFMRPLDLSSLVKPLEAGRILAVIDESSLDYYHELGRLAASPAASILAPGGTGGPLFQGGMIFRNPANDGELYGEFWRRAIDAARAELIEQLPWDDMAVLAYQFSQGQPLWERALPLGYEWNYITDTQKDPGVFGGVCHFGGRRAQAQLLNDAARMFPRNEPLHSSDCWGTIAGTSGTLIRGRWSHRSNGVSDSKSHRLELFTPFALTWQVDPGSRFHLKLEWPRLMTEPANETAFYVYRDGRLFARYQAENDSLSRVIDAADSETISVIGVASHQSHIFMDDPFTGID